MFCAKADPSISGVADNKVLHLEILISFVLVCVKLIS